MSFITARANAREAADAQQFAPMDRWSELAREDRMKPLRGLIRASAMVVFCVGFGAATVAVFAIAMN